MLLASKAARLDRFPQQGAQYLDPPLQQPVAPQFQSTRLRCSSKRSVLRASIAPNQKEKGPHLAMRAKSRRATLTRYLSVCWQRLSHLLLKLRRFDQEARKCWQQPNRSDHVPEEHEGEHQAHVSLELDRGEDPGEHANC